MSLWSSGAGPSRRSALPRDSGGGLFHAVSDSCTQAGESAEARGALLAIVGELLSPTRCASCERPGELVCGECLRKMTRIDPAHACPLCGAPFGELVCTECRGEATAVDRCLAAAVFEGPPARIVRAYKDGGEPLCGAPFGELVCTECRGEATAVDRCLAAAVFEGPPARIVRAYKDGGERRLAVEIAQLMVGAARDAERSAPDRYAGLLSDADALVFVPVTAEAYRRRGFDHMEAVAREASRACGAPVVDALLKHGSADQREFSREERLASSRDVYEVVEDVRGARLLLLDDVITTGATVGAAAAALKRAGARRVDALAFARVW